MLNSVPQTSHVGVLTPGSSECGIFGDKASQGVIGASLVARWVRICLPMQETRVRSLV